MEPHLYAFKVWILETFIVNPSLPISEQEMAIPVVIRFVGEGDHTSYYQQLVSNNIHTQRIYDAQGLGALMRAEIKFGVRLIWGIKKVQVWVPHSVIV